MKLWCRCEFCYWIFADLTWKSIKEPLDPAKSPPPLGAKAKGSSPLLLGQLNLEITLAKGPPERWQRSILSTSTIINERSLTDEAFQPKLYTIRIERGNFIVPAYIGFPGGLYGTDLRFELRLIFDKSPYPPRSEWRKPDGGPDSNQFWEHKEFVGRQSKELEKKRRAMNQVPSALCTVS
jgi:hypothetical protein